jgi:hypothetical protein
MKPSPSSSSPSVVPWPAWSYGLIALVVLLSLLLSSPASTSIVDLMTTPTDPVGVMGRTFDPIHVGHLVAASRVADRLGLSRVVFVPTGQPWQKSSRTVSRARTRYAMTVIATATDPRFTVSRVDLAPRPHLHGRHPARPAPGVRRIEPVLHHRSRCPQPDPDVARS